MYEIVVVRYGEIFLKSEYVKRRFEDRLAENMRLTLERRNLKGKIIRSRHRIYVETEDAETVSAAVSNVFGVVSASPAIKVNADLEGLSAAGAKLAAKVILPDESFAVRVKRTGTHPFSSMDAERAISSRILEDRKLTVDLTDPDKTIFAEIVDDMAYVFDKKIPGVGGLPYMSQGKVVCLVSTGIDSPVAAWMMMHRGCETVMVHLGSEDEIKKTLDALEGYAAHKIRVYAIPYDSILAKIGAHADRLTCVICKRTMLRIAAKVAAAEKAHGIVTGDNMGQVASQTLENLEVLSEVYSPIYRPLIGMDKEEIIERARRIGTYELAKKAQKCPHVPKMPVTRSNLDEIKKLETEIGVAAIVEGLELKCARK
jgi:thiamine biosynthesis protein ThiI